MQLLTPQSVPGPTATEDPTVYPVKVVHFSYAPWEEDPWETYLQGFFFLKYVVTWSNSIVQV